MMLRILPMIIAILSLTCQSSEKAVQPGPTVVVKPPPGTVTSGTHANQPTTNRHMPEAVLRQLERELAARLRHEILWNDAPQWFHVPKDRKAQLTLYKTSGSVWYCSHALGACAQYRLENGQLEQRSDSTECEDEDEKNALLKFVGQTVTAGRDLSLRGLDYSTGTIGSITLTLDSKEEIVKYYKQLRPAKLKSLRDWLKTNHKDAGYRSITIACFDTKDLNVHLYGDRPEERGGSLIFSVFWNEEIKEWTFEGMLKQRQNPEIFAQQKAIVQEIACDTIWFK